MAIDKKVSKIGQSLYQLHFSDLIIKLCLVNNVYPDGVDHLTKKDSHALPRVECVGEVL